MFIPSQPLLWTITGLYGALAVGTLARILMLRGVPFETAQIHRKSVRTWWVLAISLTIASLLGGVGVVLLLAIAGTLSLREYLQIIGWKRVGTTTAVSVFASVPIYYAFVLCGHGEWLRSAAPVAIVLGVGTIRALLGMTKDFIRVTTGMIWGLMLFVYCLSHASFLLTLQESSEPIVGTVGWFLFLVLLTECNDIAQALFGRRFGRTKITPHISPNKSLEGLLGGILTTILLAVLLAPWLTNLMPNRSGIYGVLCAIMSGLLIGLFGFLGDINKSGIKRDVGIKDSGTMLPGQGGMMDRIDSLTFSAPAFYYFLQVILPLV